MHKLPGWVAFISEQSTEDHHYPGVSVWSHIAFFTAKHYLFLFFNENAPLMQIKVLYKKLMAISPYSSRDSFIYTLEMVKQYTWETEKCSQY